MPDFAVKLRVTEQLHATIDRQFASLALEDADQARAKRTSAVPVVSLSSGRGTSPAVCDTRAMRGKPRKTNATYL